MNNVLEMREKRVVRKETEGEFAETMTPKEAEINNLVDDVGDLKDGKRRTKRDGKSLFVDLPIRIEIILMSLRKVNDLITNLRDVCVGNVSKCCHPIRISNKVWLHKHQLSHQPSLSFSCPLDFPFVIVFFITLFDRTRRASRTFLVLIENVSRMASAAKRSRRASSFSMISIVIIIVVLVAVVIDDKRAQRISQWTRRWARTLDTGSSTIAGVSTKCWIFPFIVIVFRFILFGFIVHGVAVPRPQTTTQRVCMPRKGTSRKRMSTLIETTRVSAIRSIKFAINIGINIIDIEIFTLDILFVVEIKVITHLFRIKVRIEFSALVDRIGKRSVPVARLMLQGGSRSRESTKTRLPTSGSSDRSL